MSSAVNATQDQLLAQLNAGREAGFVLRAINERIVQMTTEIMENAVAAERTGELDGERAKVAWGKISAIWGLQERLEDEMKVGEAAATQLAVERGGQPA